MYEFTCCHLFVWFFFFTSTHSGTFYLALSLCLVVWKNLAFSSKMVISVIMNHQKENSLYSCLACLTKLYVDPNI